MRRMDDTEGCKNSSINYRMMQLEVGAKCIENHFKAILQCMHFKYATLQQAIWY